MAYEEYYHYAWAVYLLASIGFMAVWYKYSGIIKNGEIRQYVCLIPAIILFMPASNGADAYAPAFILALGDGLTHGVQAALKGVVPILYGLLVGAIVLAIIAIVRRAKKQKEA